MVARFKNWDESLHSDDWLERVTIHYPLVDQMERHPGADMGEPRLALKPLSDRVDSREQPVLNLKRASSDCAARPQETAREKGGQTRATNLTLLRAA